MLPFSYRPHTHTLRGFSILLFLHQNATFVQICNIAFLRPTYCTRINPIYSVCLSVFLSICLSVLLFICLSVLLSICLSVLLYFCLSVLLSICLSFLLSICLSALLSICLPVFFLSICLSVLLSICPSVLLSICLTVLLSIRLSVSLSLLSFEIHISCADVERPDDRAAVQVLDGRNADHHGHPEGEAGGRGRIQGRPHQRARHRRARVQHLYHRSQQIHSHSRIILSACVCSVIYDRDMGQLKGERLG
jgi:hypothetical protein